MRCVPNKLREVGKYEFQIAVMLTFWLLYIKYITDVKKVGSCPIKHTSRKVYFVGINIG